MFLFSGPDVANFKSERGKGLSAGNGVARGKDLPIVSFRMLFV